MWGGRAEGPGPIPHTYEGGEGFLATQQQKEEEEKEVEVEVEEVTHLPTAAMRKRAKPKRALVLLIVVIILFPRLVIMPDEGRRRSQSPVWCRPDRATLQVG